MTMTVIQIIMICISSVSVAATSDGIKVVADSNMLQVGSQFHVDTSHSENPFLGEKPDRLAKQSYLRSRERAAAPNPQGKEETLRKFIPFSMAALLGLLLIFIFVSCGKTGLSSLYACYLQRYIVFFILMLTTCFSILFYYWIFSDSLRHGQLFSACLYVLPLTPFIIGVLFYKVIYSLITKYDLWHLKMNAAVPKRATRSLTKRLIYDLNIKAKVSVVQSEFSDISPYVIGTSHECCIVLPSNYDELLEDSCKNAELKEGLNRLILSHELAHIKNGDTDLLSLYWAIAKPLKWFCIISIVLHFVIRGFIASSSVTVLYTKDMIFFNLTVLCILFMSMRYIIRKRECLADAVASQMLNPEVMQKLTSESKSILSPLEAYIFSLTSKSPLNRFCFGYALNKRGRFWDFKIFKKKVSDIRLAYLDRTRDYLSKKVALYGFTVSIEDIFFVVAFTAIIFSTARFLKLGLIVHPLLSFNAPENIDFKAFIYSDEPELRRFYITGLSVYLNLILSVIISGYLIILHKDPSGQKRIDRATQYLIECHQKLTKYSFRSQELNTLILKLIIYSSKMAFIHSLILCYIYFHLLISLIPNFFWKPFEFEWVHLEVPDFFSYIITSALVYLFAHLNYERYHHPCTKVYVNVPFRITLNIGLFKLALEYFLLGTVAIAFIVIEPVLNIYTKIAIPTIALMLYHHIYPLTGISIFFCHNFIEQEGMVYQRHFRRKIYFPTYLIRNRPTGINVIKRVLFHEIYSSLIPFCLTIAVCYVILLKADLWHFNHIHEIREADWQMHLGNAEYGIFKRLFLILYSGFSPEHRITSLLISLLLLLSMAIVAFLDCCINPLPFIEKKERMFEKVKQQVFLSKLLKLDKHRISKEQAYAVEKVLPKISSEYPYIYGYDKFPLFTSTCDAILILHRHRKDITRIQQMVDWIKSCTSSGGGFAACPGIEPDFLHTQTALSTLDEIGQLDASLKQLNCKWLKTQLNKLMDCEESGIADLDWLFFAKDILLGLSFVSSGSNISKEEAKRISREAYWKWQQNKQSPLYTMLFVSIIKSMYLANMCYDDEISMWLHEHERNLAGLSVKSQLSEIVQYVTIISLVYPQGYRSRESIIQVRDNLNKLYTNG